LILAVNAKRHKRTINVKFYKKITNPRLNLSAASSSNKRLKFFKQSLFNKITV